MRPLRAGKASIGADLKEANGLNLEYPMMEELEVGLIGYRLAGLNSSGVD